LLLFTTALLYFTAALRQGYWEHFGLQITKEEEEEVVWVLWGEEGEGEL
jgi:hypothetical protein